MDVESTVEQLKSNLSWLENERRKDKTALDSLEARLANLEIGLPPINQQLIQLSSDLARASSQLSRFDQIETNILQIRVETTRTLESIEKQRVDREREAEKARRSDLDTLNKAVGEALKDPKLVARLAEIGGIPKPMTPAEFGKLIADETEKWRKVVEFAGVSVD